MDIAFVSTFRTECGIASYTLDLAKALKRLGHNCTVLAEKLPSNPSNADASGTYDGIPYIRCWNRRLPSHNKPLGTIQSSEKKPDIVHIQHEFGLFPNARTLNQLVDGCDNMGIPVVITYHTVLPGMLPDPNSEAIVHTARGLTEVPFARVIPHGFDHFDHVGGQSILVPGFISESKGISEIVEAFLQSCLPHNLVIVGKLMDPSIQQNIDALFRRDLSGRKERIKVQPTHVSDAALFEYFAQAAVVVLGRNTCPKNQGPMSASGMLHKAIGHGVPILAKDCLLHEDDFGAALKWSNKWELKDLFDTVVCYSEHLAELKKRVVRAKNCWSWDHSAEAHVRVYEGI